MNMINDLIASCLANQIAGFTSDFRMNMISTFISLIDPMHNSVPLK